MLEVDIHYSRPGFQLQVSEQFSLDGVTGVMGASGCGKTTLLRCIAGLEQQVQGSVRFQGGLWQSGVDVKGFVPPEKRGVGYIFQDGRLFPHLCVKGNLLYGGSRQKRHGDRKGPSLDDVVDWLGISDLLPRAVTSLSGGQRQRVAIGRALISAPRLLLMDEPMAALDWASRTSIMPQLRNINRDFGVPVIFVSHDREEMARLSDELMVMDNGLIKERGRTHQLLNRAEGLLADDHAMSVLKAEVTHVDTGYGVTDVTVDGRALVVNQDNLQLGQQVRLVVPAAEVSLCLDPVERISVQNRVLTKLTEIRDIDDHHALVVLTLEEQKLLALITRRSRHRLDLTVGMTVYAHFKAACLEVM